MFILLGVLLAALLNQKTVSQIPGTTTIKVNGMTCSHCEANVVNAIMSLDGSKSVSANHQTGEVIIETSNFNLLEIKETLDSYNYSVHLENE